MDEPQDMPQPDLGAEYIFRRLRAYQADRSIGVGLFWMSFVIYLGTVGWTASCVFLLFTQAFNGWDILIFLVVAWIIMIAGLAGSILLGLLSVYYWRGGILLYLVEVFTVFLITAGMLWILFKTH